MDDQLNRLARKRASMDSRRWNAGSTSPRHTQNDNGDVDVSSTNITTLSPEAEEDHELYAEAKHLQDAPGFIRLMQLLEKKRTADPNAPRKAHFK